MLYFNRALKLNRNYLSAWTLMGHEYVEMKNPAAAIGKMSSLKMHSKCEPPFCRSWEVCCCVDYRRTASTRAASTLAFVSVRAGMMFLVDLRVPEGKHHVLLSCSNVQEISLTKTCRPLMASQRALAESDVMFSCPHCEMLGWLALRRCVPAGS